MIRTWDGTGWVPANLRLGPDAAVARVWDGESWRALNDGGDSGSGPLPPTTDPIIQQMRPLRHATVVDIGPDDDFSETVNAAVAARPAASYDTRILFRIAPGEYPDVALTRRIKWVSFVSTTGNPDDVLLIGDPDYAAKGVLDVNEGMYAEGITVRSTISAQTGTYAVHGEQQWTKIFARCRLEAAPMFWAFGVDGGDGGTTVFYQSRLVTDNASATVIHGPSTMAGENLTVAFVESEVSGSINLSQMYGSDGGAETWVIDSTTPIVVTDHLLHLAGSTVGTVTAPSQDSREDWPVPSDGLSDYDWRRVYGG